MGHDYGILSIAVTIGWSSNTSPAMARHVLSAVTRQIMSFTLQQGIVPAVSRTHLAIAGLLKELERWESPPGLPGLMV